MNLFTMWLVLVGIRSSEIGPGGCMMRWDPGHTIGCVQTVSFPLLPWFLRTTSLRPLTFLVEPHLIGAAFCQAWMPYFCRSGHPQFFGFIGPLLLQENVIDLQSDHWSGSVRCCQG